MQKIAVFYDNVKESLGPAGLTMEEALRQLSEAGLNSLYGNEELLREDLPALRPIMVQLGMDVEGMYKFLDFVHEPEQSTADAVSCIDFAAEIGARNVLLIPGFLPQEVLDQAAAVQAMKEGLRRAVTYGRSRQIDVTLEDFDGVDAPFNSAATLADFADAVDGLKIAFDTGNFIMLSEDEVQAYEQFKDKTVVVHVKDRARCALHPGDKPKAALDGTMVYPCAVGKGYIRIPEIISRLTAAGSEAALVAELFDVDSRCLFEEILYSVRYLADSSR